MKEKTTMSLRIAVSVLLALAVSMTAQAGLFKDAVDVADLAQLSPEGLESLKESEFAAFVARVRLQAAKEREDQAQGALKAAQRNVSVQELDMKAAAAETKAAKANQDEERLAAAEILRRDARSDLEIAQAFETWKKDERAATRAAVKSAEARLDLAEAQRDHARIERLAAENVPASAKHDYTDSAKRVAKRQSDADKASRRAEKAAATAAKSAAAYDESARRQAPPAVSEAGAS